MNASLGLKFFPAAAILSLAGCLGVEQDKTAETRQMDSQRIQFVEESASGLAKTVFEGDFIDGFASELERIGCPKLAQLFRDMYEPGVEGVPQSFRDYLACFGITGSGTVDDVDAIMDRFDNPQQLLNCICGGTGLSDLFGDLKWTTFAAQTSSAAGAAFNASTSNAGGTGFSGGASSTAESEFDARGSNAGGTGFQAR